MWVPLGDKRQNAPQGRIAEGEEFMVLLRAGLSLPTVLSCFPNFLTLKDCNSNPLELPIWEAVATRVSGWRPQLHCLRKHQMWTKWLKQNKTKRQNDLTIVSMWSWGSNKGKIFPKLLASTGYLPSSDLLFPVPILSWWETHDEVTLAAVALLS